MTDRRTLYHSTPIYYVNDVPHPGHAYTTIAADALARARRLQGHRVFFLTGTDEHGQNIERIAREKGKAPQAYCDEIAAVFKALWVRLDVKYDRFIRTTDEIHRRGVLELWRRMTAATAPGGQPAIYRGKYAGWYCPRCEAFKDESELKEPGHLCPDHERPCEWTEEENYFFRLSAYSDWLKEEIESNRLLIEPAGRRNEVLSVIRQGLRDFSVSRARVKWGIPVPEEPAHVFYVWMDALSNYVTALGFADEAPEYREFWLEADERLHFVGKEIIRFHCLYWPAMLRSAGIPAPSRVFAHGWLTKGGKKLSKTTGNVIDPDALIDRYGSDAFRYFFLREGSFGQDWDFTEDAFVSRYNSDLANDLGNLVSRALTMAARFTEGRIPPRPASLDEGDVGLEVQFQSEKVDWDATGTSLVASVFARYESLDFAGALSLLWSWIGQLNQRIVVQAPWEMAKDPGQRSELGEFLYRLLEAIRLIAVMAWPVMPTASERVLGMMGRAAGPLVPGDLEWGGLQPGKALPPVEALFPRIEVPAPGTAWRDENPNSQWRGVSPRPQKEKKVPDPKEPASAPASLPVAAPAAAGPPAQTTQAQPPGAAMITIDDFAKMELRVALVKSAEKIPGSKKLLKLQVDLGDEVRQIVSGISDAYTPESLVGRKVVLVANLKPAKLMGVESFGMVLAASLDGKAVLCGFDADVPPGTKVK